MSLAVVLTLLQILGSEVATLVGVREWYSFEEGKRGPQKGFIYTILLTNNACASLQVKVAGTTAVTDQESLNRKNAALQFQLAKFVNFQAKPYVDRGGQIQYSCTAEKIVLVDNNGTGAAKA